MDLGEISKLLMKMGGIIILVLGALGALKYVFYIILLYVFKGALDLLATLNPVLAGISIASDWIAALGSVVLFLLLVLNVVFAYFGYRLLKSADEIPMPANIRDKWVVTLAVLLAFSLITGFPFIAIAALLPIAGLIIAPIQRTTPQAQA